ncbi:PAS domain-containing protein [Streptomyces sp. NBC_00690]|uniref:PAS domain-containing protein n=1 Tax=Streptomyces sp. NBC_00690 TaxID=2975808 RepID=UPI002E2D99D4|nr:PAS domain-containing protein [Streptomyces sp. NBC_00690]
MDDSKGGPHAGGEAPAADGRFVLFMDYSPAFSFLADREDRLVWVNETFLRWLDRPREDVLGVHPDELHGPGAAEQFSPSTERVIATGEALSMEQTVRLADGSTMFLVGHKFPVPQPDGTVLVGGTFVDMTARVKAERAWTEAEERFRTFMQLLPALAYTKDSQLRYTWANPAFLRAAGRELSEIIGRRTEDFRSAGPPQSDEEGEESAVITDGRPRSFRARFTRADGTLGHAFGYRFPLSEQGDDTVGGVFVDLTEEMAVRDRMVERETRLATLFERSPVGIAVIDLEGALAEVNPAFAALLESGAAELQRMALIDIAADGPDSWVRPALRELLDGRRAQHRVDTELIRPQDGSPVPVSLLLTLAHDSAGDPQEFIAMVSRRPASQSADASGWPEDEVTILQLVAAGASDAQVARQLGMGESTVRLRLGALKRRLDARNRAHLVARAYQAGVLTTEES